MTTDQKGAIAETAIVHAAAKLGIGVFKPLTDGERYDLIFDVRPKLIRVQCKWAARRGDTLAVRFYSCRRSSDGLVKRVYSPDEIDAFAAFCADVDCCYFFPINEFVGRTGVQLRFGPARNNQKLGIRMAKNYEFAATLGQL
jgi:PD-(D/E)XK nuclease superfamily protein